MQMIHNYHPYDVEIWAVDYKSVEFRYYMDKKAPHFRVIAKDSSVEFSLSLIDLIYKEYNARIEEFDKKKVNNIEGYREKMGPYSMPRIVVFIDEFQLMTQAVQEFTDSTYRTKLENLLKLTRATGISFIFCSQTISTGLNRLTDSARQQIGCRLSLMHNVENEIRETLALSGQNATEAIEKGLALKQGQVIYKRIRLRDEPQPDKNKYELLHGHILFIDDATKSSMIDAAWKINENYFRPRMRLLYVVTKDCP